MNARRLLSLILIILVAVTTLAAEGDCETRNAPDTLERPRPTPRPPVTPTPVDIIPTATACPTVAEERYFDDMASELRRVGTLTIMMSEDFQRASENPYLVEDPFWLMGMGNQFYAISGAADDILDINAPSSAVKVRAAADQMAHRLKTSMTLYEIALDEKVGEPKRGRERRDLDMNMLDEATTILIYAEDDGRHVSGLMASFCQIEGRD